MSDAISALEAAINDVGYWLHWEHKLPDSMQIQFGGVQLDLPPAASGQAPTGQIALRFLRPTSVSFLWHHSAPADLLPDWPERLRHDAFGPCDITRGTLTLSEPAAVLAVLQQARRILSATGADPRFDGLAGAPVRMAFFAGPVGLVVGAEELQVFAPTGRLDLAELPALRARWLDYRRRYFAAKAGGESAALPLDYTCEAAGPEQAEAAAPAAAPAGASAPADEKAGADGASSAAGPAEEAGSDGKEARSPLQ